MKRLLSLIFVLFLVSCDSIEEAEKSDNSYRPKQTTNKIIHKAWKGVAMPHIDPIHLSTTIVLKYLGKDLKGNATGFFYLNKQNDLYLVTNKHIIYGDNFSEKNAEPKIDKIKIKIHTDKNDLSKNKTITIDLFKKENRLWREHSKKYIDIVCIPLDLDRNKYLFAFANESFLDASNIKIGFEKIFVMGYPYGWHDSLHNLPITRIGHLSSPFGVPFRGYPFMLGDVETHPGMSGSPVFMHLVDYVTVDKGKPTLQMGQSRIILLGVYSGNPVWKLKDENANEFNKIPRSLSVIWFGGLIKEIIGE